MAGDPVVGPDMPAGSTIISSSASGQSVNLAAQPAVGGDLPSIGQASWGYVAAPLLQGTADVANGGTNLAGHTVNLVNWFANGAVETVNALGEMSNSGATILPPEPFPYLNVTDWSRNLFMQEPDWSHNAITLSSELLLGAGTSKVADGSGASEARHGGDDRHRRRG